MADFTEVADVIRDTIAAALYPSGTGATSAVGFRVAVYQGWPDQAKLAAELAQGNAHVSVWPTPQERPSADHFPEWQLLSVTAPTLTAAVGATTVTLGGTVSTPQTVAVIADNKAFAYAVQAGDTLTSIAAAMATGLTTAGVAATASGAVVTLTAAKKIAARVGGQGTSIRELRRQERVFQVSCWAGDHAKRDTLGKFVDAVLSRSWRIALPDGSSANLVYRSAAQHDESQKQLIYRRDLMYGADYATTETRIDTQVLVGTTATAAANVIASGVAVLTNNF